MKTIEKRIKKDLVFVVFADVLSSFVILYFVFTSDLSNKCFFFLGLVGFIASVTSGVGVIQILIRIRKL